MTTSKIRRLPEHLVNQIAAGEIVERPANVIKELVENSIDAQAKTIEVIIRQGGRSLITVIDNGKGMTKENLTLAVESHTTSKLLEDNLNAIETLGFRGEALPSIASVSTMEIASRPRDGGQGWRLKLEDGKSLGLIPAVCSIGTQIKVTELFHRVPARLKFMKSIQTETEYIQDAITYLGMARPDIGFKLATERRQILFLEPTDLQNRLAALLGEEVFENLIPIEYERDRYSLKGYIGLPTLNRHTSRYCHLFVNQRWVRGDKVLAHAIRAAYGDTLPRDRYPLVVLFLTVPQGEVDINVHPAKSEVRFRDPPLVRDFVLVSLREAIRTQGHLTATTHGTEALKVLNKRKNAAETPSQRQTEKKSSPVNQRQSVVEEKSSPVNQRQSVAEEKPSSVNQRQSGAEEKSSSTSKSAAAKKTAAEKRSLKTRGAKEETSQASPDLIEDPDPPLGFAISQLHQRYILSQTKTGLVLVDQHAAHERIVYERLKESLKNPPLQSQRLLLPEVVSLSVQNIQRLLDHQETLRNLGVDLESFGVDCVIAHSLPTLLSSHDISTLIRDLADALRESETLTGMEEKLEKICARLSCYGSIRAGSVLSVSEMNALLRQMESTPYSGQCNHGRPTYIQLKLSDLDRLFERS